MSTGLCFSQAGDKAHGLSPDCSWCAGSQSGLSWVGRTNSIWSRIKPMRLACWKHQVFCNRIALTRPSSYQWSLCITCPPRVSSAPDAPRWDLGPWCQPLVFLHQSTVYLLEESLFWFQPGGGRCSRHRRFRIVGAASQNMHFTCCLYVVRMEGTSCDFKQTLETCCILRWSNKYLFFQDLKKAKAWGKCSE